MSPDSHLQRIGFFSRLVGIRFWIAIVISILAALAESVGWGLILPVLQLTTNHEFFW